MTVTVYCSSPAVLSSDLSMRCVRRVRCCLPSGSAPTPLAQNTDPGYGFLKMCK